MKYGLYVMRDEVAQLFGRVTQDINDDCARRGFRQAMANNENIKTFRAGDFALFRVAEYDDCSGEVVPCNPPKLLERGVDNVSDSV